MKKKIVSNKRLPFRRYDYAVGQGCGWARYVQGLTSGGKGEVCGREQALDALL